MKQTNKLHGVRRSHHLWPDKLQMTWHHHSVMRRLWGQCHNCQQCTGVPTIWQYRRLERHVSKVLWPSVNFKEPYRLVPDMTVSPVIHPNSKCAIQCKLVIKHELSKLEAMSVIKWIADTTDCMSRLSFMENTAVVWTYASITRTWTAH